MQLIWNMLLITQITNDKHHIKNIFQSHFYINTTVHIFNHLYISFQSGVNSFINNTYLVPNFKTPKPYCVEKPVIASALLTYYFCFCAEKKQWLPIAYS